MAANGLAGAQTQPLEAYRREVSQGDPRQAATAHPAFSMKQGAARIAGLQNQGFVVVRLDRITLPTAEEAARVIPATQAGLKEALLAANMGAERPMPAGRRREAQCIGHCRDRRARCARRMAPASSDGACP